MRTQLWRLSVAPFNMRSCL